MTRKLRRAGAWFAIVGLLLQVGLAAAHSARNFDHFLGDLRPAASLATAELASDAGSPSPAAPAVPDLDHCAIGLGLAAAGSFVPPAAGPVPLPPLRATARLEGEPQTIAASCHRHLLPPVRAPPVLAISV